MKNITKINMSELNAQRNMEMATSLVMANCDYKLEEKKNTIYKIMPHERTIIITVNYQMNSNMSICSAVESECALIANK